MHQDILEALQPRKKEIEFAGQKLVILEPSIAANLGMTGEEDAKEQSWKILIACVFDTDGKPVFTEEDIPALKQGGRWKIAPLIAAMNEVCGFDAVHEEKN